MKNVSKIICLIMVLTMCFTFVACGNTDSDEDVSSAEISNETVVEYAPTDPEYWRDEYSQTMSEFYAKWELLDENSFSILKPFSEKPQITDEFLNDMNELNALYEEIGDLYYETCRGEHPDVTVDEYIDMEYFYDAGWIVEPMNVISYDDTWDDACSYGIYDANKGWMHNYSSRYASGLFELSEHYYVFVEWMENFEAIDDSYSEDFEIDTESFNDTYSENFEAHRSYKVVDSTSDAYLLLSGVETGRQLVRITATENNSLE